MMKIAKTITLLITSLLVFTSIASDAAESEKNQATTKQETSVEVTSHQIILNELNINFTVGEILFDEKMASATAKEIIEKERFKYNKKQDTGFITLLAE